MAEAGALLGCMDVVVAGRYDREQRVAGRAGLRSSANQTVHVLSERYGAAEVEGVPAAEVIVGADGGVTVSGVDPVCW
jgi:hypothetical protein